jgi:hypothetical protein
MALYYASKGFVRLFSEALYQELRYTGVTVTCVAPGWVRTPFHDRARVNSRPLFRFLPKLDPEDVAERAWQGFKSGHRLVVPGFSSKLMVLVAALSPSSAMLALIGRLQRSGNDPCRSRAGEVIRKVQVDFRESVDLARSLNQFQRAWLVGCRSPTLFGATGKRI